RKLAPRALRTKAEQKPDLKIYARYERVDAAEEELLAQGSYQIIETGATGAPEGRPTPGVTRETLLGELAWSALNETASPMRQIGVVTNLPGLTASKRERMAFAVIVGLVCEDGPNMEALAGWFGLHRRRLYERRRDGVELIKQGETLARMEEKLDRLLDAQE